MKAPWFLAILGAAACADAPSASPGLDAAVSLDAALADAEGGAAFDAQPGDAQPDGSAQCGLATYDYATFEIARVICGGRDCEVCVQDVLPDGAPVRWLALENASVCDCPGPRIVAYPDGGPDAGDLDATVPPGDAS